MTYEDIEALDPAERKALCGQIYHDIQHAFHPETGLAYVDGLYDQDALCAVARVACVFQGGQRCGSERLRGGGRPI